MRPIEFRVWDKISKRMDAPDYITYDGRPGFWANESNGKLFIAKREDVVLMQFTGLRDKNGKKIFEGDVVEYQHTPKVLYVPKWLNGCFWLTIDGKGYDGTFSDFTGACEESEVWEVIGNIYDNPELLEVKEN